MTTLSDIEVCLLENYVISNNFTEFSEAHFYSALGRIVPSWRLEDLAGQLRVYEHLESEAYTDYINNLMKENK